MKSTNSHDNDVQGLIDLMENHPLDFSHLNIFMSRKGMSNWSSEDEFLMVTAKVFGKVRVLDLMVNKNYIHVKILDVAEQEVGYIPVDIEDKNPKVLFVNWNDIRNLVLDDIHRSDDDLLEFFF